MEIVKSTKNLKFVANRWIWQIVSLSILLLTSLGFHNQVYICSKHTAQLVCILMPVKYAPAHTKWVGASTKGNTVDVLHVYRHPFGTGEAQWSFAQYPHSSPLTREEGGGREGHTKRERENILLSNAAFDFFSPHTGLHTFSEWNFSNIVTAELLLLLTVSRTVLHRNLKSVVVPGEMQWGNISSQNTGWYLTGMARGIESLVSLNPFCSMDSAQGGHSDNCKFWLLDLGRCLDHV